MLALVLATLAWAGSPVLAPGDLVDTRVRVDLAFDGGGEVLGPLVQAMLGADRAAFDCRWTTQVLAAEAREVRLARVTLGPCDGPDVMQPWGASAEGRSVVVRGGPGGTEVVADGDDAPPELIEALTNLPLPLLVSPDDLTALADDPGQVLGVLGGMGAAEGLRVEQVQVTDRPAGRAAVRFVLLGEAPGSMPMTLRAPLEVVIERATGRVERAAGDVELAVDAAALGALAGAPKTGKAAALRITLALDLTTTWGVAPLSPSDANRARR